MDRLTGEDASLLRPLSTSLSPRQNPLPLSSDAHLTEMEIDYENVDQTDEVEGNGDDLEGNDLGEGVRESDDFNTITPKVGIDFPTTEDAYKFYNRYALKMGFGTRKSSSTKSRSENLVISRKMVCSKEGKRRPSKKQVVDDEEHNRRDIRVECKAKMRIIRTQSETWRVSLFVPEHNHELSTPSKAQKHRSHKKVHRQPIVNNLITQLHSEGISNANIARVVNAFESRPQQMVTSQQVHDHLRIERKNNLGKSCANIVKHFLGKNAEDPNFYSSFELEDDCSLRSVFWADRRSQESYEKFNDVIIFDVTYRTNNLNLPFSPFTGINHHRQSSLFGCALLADETEETFVWLFQQWLKCMGGKAPGAIITDQDAAIGNVIAVVFPNTIHRFCDWHLDRNIGEHMVHLNATHGPEFELYFNNLRSSASISEAEDRWNELMIRFKLKEKSWLPKLWERRASWLPCYLKDKFLAGTRTSQRSESIKSFFDTYVNSSTPLHEFVVQYDRALASRRKAEEDEDFKSVDTKPVLTLEWPLEEQAGRCYTPALFNIFKQEMKDAHLYWADKVHKEGTVTTYIVGRATKERSKWRNVSFDSDGVVVSCECKHFENVGLLCRHALCIIWKKHVAEIPSRYILKRWTTESRHRFVDVEKSTSVGDSEVDHELMRGLHYKCKKALEIANNSPNFADEYNRFLTRKLEEYDNSVEANEVVVPSQVDPIVRPMSQNSCNFISDINFRDPTAPARHKGRPRIPSILKSGLEVSQEESTKKQKTCGYYGEKGHYRTGCSKAKAANDVACRNHSAAGVSQAHGHAPRG